MITDLFGIPLAELVRGAGYFGIFAIVLAESGLPFGFIFPGDSLLLLQVEASQGYFVQSPLLLLTTSAAIIGDSIGYSIGSYFGPKLFTGKGRFF